MGDDVILELTSADLPKALATIMKSGIEITDIREISALSVHFRVSREDANRLIPIMENQGNSIRQIKTLGIYQKFRSLTRHWVLLLGIAVLLILTAWLPTRVLFLRVEGNHYLPSTMILEKATQCGISFGAERGEVRSEHAKNALLDLLPELQWAGINTYGCVGVITVEEREIHSPSNQERPGNIRASKDGIILEITALSGTAAVKVGQAVREGDLLISGYTDCSHVLLFQGAEGEVYGRTLRKISAKTPEDCMVRTINHDSKQKFSLIIGKKRINFYEDSGILDTGCVKIYKEYYMMLPGGFLLPIKLVVETSIPWDLQEDQRASEDALPLLEEQVAAYLQTQMIAGSVLSAKGSADGYSYTGEFICREMIGRMTYEEIVTEYGEDR